jgi:hypothetical protein
MPPAQLPIQARVPALAMGNNAHGTVRHAGDASVMATSLAVAGAETLDAARFTPVWTEGFDSSFGHVSRVWGDVKVANSEATLTSTKASGWQSSGMMVPPTGPDAGDGYGLYTITARIDDAEGPGAYACLWPGTDVWPGPELDIFEKASAANNSGYSTIHRKGPDGGDWYEVYLFPTTIYLNQTHTYAMEWAADRISLYIDNTLIYSTNANVPKDFAHGGQDLAFGVGMQPGWAASQQNADGTNVLHVFDMSYAAPAAAQPTLGVSDASVAEGGLLNFTVSLSAASANAVTVAYSTANGSATAGSDYTARSGTLTFAANETSRVVAVQTTGDTTYEPDESLILRLASPTGATLGDAEGTGTIVNNDPAPAGKTITGNPGNNTLTGTAGADTITGKRGNDVMTGLGGEDDFVFSRGDGFDRIRDFETGVDDLVFKGIGASQVSFKAASYSGVSGTDVSYGGSDHVFLERVAATSFSVANDVVFA